MSRAVITGGAGFVGSHLVERLTAEGHDVLVIDNFVSGRSRIPIVERSGARLEEADITTAKASSIIESFRPELILHLAAQMSVTGSVEDPIHDADVNILGLLRMLEAARKVRARFINTTSGGAMYGELGDDMDPFPEAYAGQPTSPYGISKKIADDYLRFYEATHGLAFVNIAPANVYGPRQDPHGEAGVVAIWAERLNAGEPCPIFGDGKQTRDFVYVTDVVESYLLAMNKGEGETFNIGTGIATTINDLYRVMAAVVGSKEPPRYEPARTGDTNRMALDVGKAERVLGWTAKVSLEEGLRLTIESFR